MFSSCMVVCGCRQGGFEENITAARAMTTLILGLVLLACLGTGLHVVSEAVEVEDGGWEGSSRRGPRA